MHRCLQVLEIVLLICNQVSNYHENLAQSDSDESDEGATSDDDSTQRDSEAPLVTSTRSSQLFALAQTCRFMKQPALESLWEEIDGIFPIIACAGRDLWRVHYGELQLVRPISPSDANIMKKYAYLVHTCRTVQWSHDPASADLWVALQDTFAGTALFPNLRSIFIGDEVMPTAVLFGTVMKIFSQSSLLIDFSARCSDLTFLPTTYLGSFIEALPNWPNLTQLILATGAPEVIHPLSRCSRLRYLEFGHLTYDLHQLLLPTDQVDSSMKSFPVLEEVQLSCDEMLHAAQFVEFLPSTVHLRALAITIVYNRRLAKEEEWLGLLQSLKKYSHSLKEICVVEEGTSIALRNITLANTLFSMLAIHFTGLTHVDISHKGDYDLVDADLKMLTEALPLLEYFRLSLLAKFQAYTIGTTIECLVYFARNCPSLSNLSIIFDANKSELPECPDPPVQGLKLTWLDVSVSPICSSSTPVAQFLLSIFPNIQRVDCEQYEVFHSGANSIGTADQLLGYIRSWSRVSRFLKADRSMVQTDETIKY